MLLGHRTAATRRLITTVVIAVAWTASTALAGTRVKANNNDNLSLSSSWTGGVVPGGSDIAAWDATVSAASSVSLGADLSWSGLRIGTPTSPGGGVTIGAGNTLTLGGGGIDLSSATQPLTISSGLTLLRNTAQTWNVGAGSSLTLNTGAFTRSPGATLNFQGSGTISTTNIANVVSTIGPWATIGSGTALNYATVYEGTVMPASPVASFSSLSSTSSGGSGLNYDITSTANSLDSNRVANALRATAAGGNTLISSNVAGTARALTVRGLMNASAGTLTIGTSPTSNVVNIAIGSTSELTVVTNTQNVVVNGAISNNGSTASALTFASGGGMLTLAGSNTYTGPTSINGGTLSLAHANALGGGGNITFGGGTLQHSGSNTADFSARIVNSLGPVAINTNGQVVTYAAAIDGSNVGGLTKSGVGTLVLAAANNYSGGTTINAGTLSAASAAGSLGSGTTNINGTSATVRGVLAGVGGGTGATGGPVNVNAFGTITAGSGATTSDAFGTLAAGATTFAGGGAYAWKVGNAAGSTPGTNWDLLSLTSLNVTATAANPFKIFLTSATNPGFVSGKTYRIAAGTVNNFDAGAFVLDTSALAGGYTPSQFTLSSGGSDVSILFGDPQAAPEPTTLALLAFAAAPLLGRRRRVAAA